MPFPDNPYRIDACKALYRDNELARETHADDLDRSHDKLAANLAKVWAPIPLVTETVRMPSDEIARAYRDPNVSQEEFKAIVTRCYPAEDAAERRAAA